MVLSANPLVSLDAGVLSIEGTEYADNVFVQEKGSSICVSVSVDAPDKPKSEYVKFDRDDVESISFTDAKAMTFL